MVRSGQPRTGRSLLEEGGATTRRSRSVRCDRSRPRTVAWKLRQRPQIRWRWRREACSSWRAIRRYPGLKRLQVGQPGSAVFRSRLARRLAGSTPEVTRRHEDQCAFSTLPEEHPIGLLRWPLLISRRSSEQARGSRPQQVGVAGLRRGQVCHCRRSDTPARGRVTRERVSCVRILELPEQVAGAHRSGRRNDAVSKLAGRMSFQRLSVPVRRLLKPS